MNKFECIKGVFGSDLKPRARLVLQCLIYHADKDGFCFPSVKTIAAECGYGISTVKRALNDLCEAGYIEKTARFDKRKNGGQTSNLYSLTGNADTTEETTHDTDSSNSEKDITEYCYNFSEGLKMFIYNTPKAALNGWTGGQFNFIPP